MGRINTCPFLISFFCIISLLILFWSADSTLDANWTPGVVLVSSSSVELDDSDSESDSFLFFFLVGLLCTFLLVATFLGEGDLSFNKTWPCMYGRRDVIRLLVKAISCLNDSGPHESFTNKSSETHIFRTPFEHSTRRTVFSKSGSS